jgi:hypothetical protein
VADDREKRMALTYGFPSGEWESARAWVKRRLQQVARREATIAYSDLTGEMARAGLVELDPRGSPLAGMLGQISTLEHEEGRPMVSAVVVHKDGDAAPGPGFWNFARKLGLDAGTGPHAELEFWTQELGRCYAYWSKH